MSSSAGAPVDAAQQIACPANSGTLRDVVDRLAANATFLAEAEARLQGLLQQKAALVHAQRLLQHQTIAQCFASDGLAYQNGRPEAAMLVHRCLLQWKSLQQTDSDTEAFMQSIITCVSSKLSDSQLASKQDGLTSPPTSPTVTTTSSAATEWRCAYWLCVSATLLALLYRHVPEHSSYLAAGGGRPSSMQAGLSTHSGSEDMGPNQPLSNAAVKVAEFQQALKSRFQTFGNLLKKKSHAAEDNAAEVSQDSVRSAASSASQLAAPSGTEGAPLLAAPLRTASSGPTPGQVFRHSLDLLLLQAYSIVRDQIKKQLTPLLPPCIQAPAPSSSAAQQGNDTPGGARSEFEKEAEATRLAPIDPTARFTLDESEGLELAADGAVPPGEAGQAGTPTPAEVAAQAALQAATSPPDPLQAWEELISALQHGLDQLRAYQVPRILIKCIFKQLLQFVNAQLFNQLLLRPDCCCASNARHVLEGLKRLDTWIVTGSADAMMRPLFQELRHIRQAATFLVTPGKGSLSVEDIHSMCASLTNQQIYRLCTTYWDDASAASAAAPTPTVHQSDSSAEGAHASSIEDAVLVSHPGHPANGVGDGVTQEAHGTAAQAQAHQASAAAAVGAVGDMVSGELLEALKSSTAGGAGAPVQGNGGLIVMFLLDDDAAPIIAPEGSTADQVLALIEGKELYGPMTLPAKLDTPECPRSCFDFIEEPLPLPAYLTQDVSKRAAARAQ